MHIFIARYIIACMVSVYHKRCFAETAEWIELDFDTKSILGLLLEVR